MYSTVLHVAINMLIIATLRAPIILYQTSTGLMAVFHILMTNRSQGIAALMLIYAVHHRDINGGFIRVRTADKRSAFIAAVKIGT